MSTPPTEEMQRLADGLLRWRGTSELGAKDVAVWFKGPKHVGIAFVGPALSLQRNALREGAFNNRYYMLDIDLQRSVGLAGASRAGYGREVPDMQTMDEPDPYRASVLEGVEQVTKDALGGEDVIDRVDATVMPDVGAPWAPKNDPTPWYSAKKRRLFVTKRPEWLIEVELEKGTHLAEQYRQTKMLGANVCLLAPKVERCGDEIVGRLPERRHFDFLVTHSFELGHRRHTKDAEAAARTIRECGGLVYPSLAVSPAPATQFGSTVLVVGVKTVLAGLKPYRGRGAWPVVVYGTDTWTTTTGEVMTLGSIQLYEELTGNRDFGIYAHPHLWTLGAPISSGGPFGDDEKMGRVLNGTKQLGATLIKRAKLWPRDMTEEEMQAAKEQRSATAEYYPIAEAKVNGVLPLTCCPLAVAPKDRAAASQAFLYAAGFKGTMIAVDVPAALLKGIEEGKDSATWRYAWMVRDVVLEYAEQKPNQRIFAVEES